MQFSPFSSVNLGNANIYILPSSIFLDHISNFLIKSIILLFRKLVIILVLYDFLRLVKLNIYC